MLIPSENADNKDYHENFQEPDDRRLKSDPSQE